MGHIGILVLPGSPLRPMASSRAWRRRSRTTGCRNFAIANPEHALYGARGKEALQHAGLWSAIESKRVPGENISQTAQARSVPAK